jgi:hypothetical protein
MTFDLILPDELVNELAEAAGHYRCTALEFACEAVESVLASRRLPRMVTVGGYGGRHVPARVEEDAEPEGYPVHLPREMEPLP